MYDIHSFPYSFQSTSFLHHILLVTSHSIHLVYHYYPTRPSSDLPRLTRRGSHPQRSPGREGHRPGHSLARLGDLRGDRKSTSLNSSHRCISYAVFCLKKKIYIAKHL